jgi:hypothetical protein
MGFGYMFLKILLAANSRAIVEASCVWAAQLMGCFMCITFFDRIEAVERAGTIADAANQN